MKFVLIGVGQAGGKIMQRFAEYDSQHNTGIVSDAIAVNTASSDLSGVQLPDEKKVLIGESKVRGQGVGTDNQKGAAIMEEEFGEVHNAIQNVDSYRVDGFLIIAGLGGGTGSGGAPVLAQKMQRFYDNIYGLGVLPSEDEGGLYSRNAARSFQKFVDSVDNLMVFDNDSWKQSGESMQGGYDTINNEIVNRFGTIFSAGEIEAMDGAVAESVVDASEIINTLESGGLTTIGHAAEEIEAKKNSGFLSRFRGGNEPENTRGELTNRIKSLTKNATLGRLTLQCNVESTERALLLVSGPPEYLNRKGIEKSRRWLEEKTNCLEVRGGDYPMPNANHVAVTVMLSGVTDVQRVRDMQRLAVETQDNIEELRENSETGLDELLQNDDADELDELF